MEYFFVFVETDLFATFLHYFCYSKYFIYFCSGVVTIGNKNVKLIKTGYGV